MKKIGKKRVWIVLILFLLAAAEGYFLWLKAKPTKIALVNFSGYKTAPMFDTVQDRFVRVDRVEWDDRIGETLRKYDIVLFQGMGMTVSEKQKAAVAELKRRGIHLYVHQDSRVESQFGTVSPEHKRKIAGYFANSSRENYRRLWSYLRYEIDGKRLFASKPEAPRILPADALFHTKPEALFQKYQDYLAYYKKSGCYKAGAPTVALIVPGDGGSARGEPGYLTGIIRSLESHGLNVVGISGGARRLAFLKEISPDLAVFFPHGRLGDENGTETLDFLKNRNIPLLVR
ncbi:MAG: hypothetical protein E7055_04830 [Lentisphaerae bacterium]|nr:hypothetical protein [Lentisphaerota bacterium]